MCIKQITLFLHCFKTILTYVSPNYISLPLELVKHGIKEGAMYEDAEVEYKGRYIL